MPADRIAVESVDGDHRRCQVQRGVVSRSDRTDLSSPFEPGLGFVQTAMVGVEPGQ